MPQKEGFWDDDEADNAIGGVDAKQSEEPPPKPPSQPEPANAATAEVTDPNIRVPPEEPVSTSPDDHLVNEEEPAGNGEAVLQRNPPPVFTATRAARGGKDLPRANRGARPEAPLVQRPRNRT